MSLHTDTLAALDWPSVLHALAEQARTPMGRRAALALEPLPDAASVRLAHDEVDEILAAEQGGAWVPTSAVGDVGDAVVRASKAAMLDKAELRAVGSTMRGLDDLANFLLSADADLPVLRELAPPLQQDRMVMLTLIDAFDPTGDLSVAAYPILGELRDRIQHLHASIRRTLDELVHGDELAEALQDRYVTQRGDRYVIPIKAGFRRRDMGIVHGVSGSGQTAFVEPTQVIALNNDLKLAEGELEAAERRILTQLSQLVGRVAERTLLGLSIATRIDLACARAALARSLRALRPRVGAEGVLHLTAARHPLLALRGVNVVPNDLALHDGQPILVISGPNTGGKTIALKTAGLCALLVATGNFVPAAEGSRVDHFHHVVALIGDHQTVHGDHSSFSSHLAALKQMLDDAAPGCLYLVDEIASGTDPQQGAALAHAILERFAADGPRAVITTHFHRLKTVGAIDDRFAMGGMQFHAGRPTWKLMVGISGESHALSVAEHQGFPPELLERARGLMGEDEQGLADVLTALERERIRAEDATLAAEALRAELAAERQAVTVERERLAARARQIEQDLAAGFRERIKGAEKAIAAVIADLQRDPSHRKVDAARQAVGALQGLLPAEPSAPAEAPPDLVVGEKVKVRKLGQKGQVTAIDDGKVQVRVGPLLLHLRPDDLERSPEALKARKTAAPKPEVRESPRAKLDDAVRLDLNTLDLRGLRVDDGIAAIERFFDQAQMARRPVVFLLHGHGTGAMKEAVRRYLPSSGYVADWQPADAHQGGDAYTAVALR